MVIRVVAGDTLAAGRRRIFARAENDGPGRGVNEVKIFISSWKGRHGNSKHQPQSLGRKNQPGRGMTDLLKTVAVATALLWSLAVATASAEELAVGRFAAEGLTGWEPKEFKGLTEYRLIPENDGIVVKATSRAAASGLVKKISFDPRRYRYLRWSWKIDQTIPAGDETTKAGDDYAARIYVVFAGKFFWQTKAINYIWANHLKRGDAIANAYTASAMMVAVESGSAAAGQWQNEERDIFTDYQKLFASEPGEASAIAIMTDTDNTGGSATAWYGDITLSTDR